MKTLAPKFIDYYMRMAELTAGLSSAVRLKVGTVIVRDHKILAAGYNGTPSGWSNECEDREYMSGDAGGWLSPDEIEERWPHSEQQLPKDINLPWRRYRLKTKPITLHSESNAILKIARSTETSEGATLFCTHAPCLDCSKLIYQSGINTVYYRQAYRETTGIEFLTESGVKVEQYTAPQ